MQPDAADVVGGVTADNPAGLTAAPPPQNATGARARPPMNNAAKSAMSVAIAAASLVMIIYLFGGYGQLPPRPAQ